MSTKQLLQISCQNIPDVIRFYDQNVWYLTVSSNLLGHTQHILWLPDPRKGFLSWNLEEFVILWEPYHQKFTIS